MWWKLKGNTRTNTMFTFSSLQYDFMFFSRRILNTLVMLFNRIDPRCKTVRMPTKITVVVAK